MFTTFVVLTGRAHCSLAVVSSNVFGLEFFDCGLTSYELQKLNSFKIYSSVFLGNVPQLIFTAIYLSKVGMTTNAMLSILASMLSVFAAVLSFCIDRDGEDMDIIAAEYYLALECNRDDNALAAGITETEEVNMKYYSGFRDSLSRQLAQLWRVSHQNIQIGKTILTKNGSITHIVHLLRCDDLTEFAVEICSDDRRSGASTMWIVRQFYKIRSSELTDIFREHFRVGSDFKAVFCDQRDRRKRAMTMGSHQEEGKPLVGWDRDIDSDRMTGYVLMEDADQSLNRK